MNEGTKPPQDVLRQDVEHHYLLTEYSNDLMLTVDSAGRITYLSPAAIRTLGYAPQEAIKRALIEFVHPDDQTDASKALAHVALGSDAQTAMEIQFLYKDGSWHLLEMVCRNLLENVAVNGIVINCHDITESVGTKHSRLRERNRLQNLLDLYRRADARIQDIEAFVIEECVRISASPLCFFGFVNPEETEMRTHLWSRHAMEGCAIDFKPVVFSIPNAGIWAEAIRTRKPLILNDFQQPDPRKKGHPQGHVQIRRLLGIPIIKGNKVVAVMAVANKEENYTRMDILHLSLFIESMWDILKRKEVEEELRKLNENLEQAVAERTRQLIHTREQLVRREKLSILGQLAGTVGHELRNPLGVMSNAVYFLNTVLEDADDIVKEYLGIIQREIDDSQQIITDLLDFARTKKPQIGAVQVNAMIRQSIHRCVIPENVYVALDLPDALPPVSADLLQMVQVFQNLITNAVQAMPDGGRLVITAQEGKEEPGVEDPPDESRGRHVKIRVTDTGSGISAENMEKLFQPLFTTKARGIGLGLVVCRNIMEIHGGKIAVESPIGEGTTFSVTIPIAEGME